MTKLGERLLRSAKRARAIAKGEAEPDRLYVPSRASELIGERLAVDADGMIQVGDPLPEIGSVQVAEGPFSVRITWAEGSRVGRTDMIDLTPMISAYTVFRPLRIGAVPFGTVGLDEFGTSISWSGIEDLQMGALTLERLAEEQG